MDECHRAGIGVIMDWVPAHFPKDQFGLYQFDGTNCYEDQNPLRAEHKEWGTMVFDYARPEVQSFLISNALFWLTEYHIDGLRVDAVASMLYLDYNRRDGEWQPNVNGDNKNLEAVAFLQKLNTAVLNVNPAAAHRGGEHRVAAGVHPASEGALGFTSSGTWLDERHAQLYEHGPAVRAGNHNKVTFSFFYAFSEHSCCPSATTRWCMANAASSTKCRATTSRSLRAARILWLYDGAPRKKLLFMGQEFALVHRME